MTRMRLPLIFCCSCILFVLSNPMKTDAQLACCTGPNAEVTYLPDPGVPAGSGDLLTISRFASIIADSDMDDFDGQTITEDNASTQTDDCYFYGSVVAYTPPVPTGSTTISSGNHYVDEVGWIHSAAETYRAYGALEETIIPCGFVRYPGITLTCQNCSAGVYYTHPFEFAAAAINYGYVLNMRESFWFGNQAYPVGDVPPVIFDTIYN